MDNVYCDDNASEHDITCHCWMCEFNKSGQKRAAHTQGLTEQIAALQAELERVKAATIKHTDNTIEIGLRLAERIETLAVENKDLRARWDIAVGKLKEIAEHEHCKEGCYGSHAHKEAIGNIETAKGHHCAAAIAQQGLKELERMK
jgi:hypothetical protein